MRKRPTDRDERIRLFVALELPATVRDKLGGWAVEALTDPALRPVPVENLHITLAFLGHRPSQDADRVTAALAGCAAPAPAIELGDPVARPARGRPHLFALPAPSAAAGRIQARLSEILLSEGLHEPERRPFWPHVTVARIRAEGRGSRRPLSVRKYPGELPAALRKPCFCRRIVLYRSELQPSGARYIPLAQVKLPGEGSS